MGVGGKLSCARPGDGTLLKELELGDLRTQKGCRPGRSSGTVSHMMREPQAWLEFWKSRLSKELRVCGLCLLPACSACFSNIPELC